MTVGINQSCIMQARLEEFLEACGAAGIGEVELRTPKLFEAHYHMSPEEIRDLIEKNNIRVTAINSLEDFGLVPEENLGILRREVETMAEYCHTCDCDLVVAPVARWFKPNPDRDWIRNLSATRLSLVADILQDHGIEVGLEPIAYDHFTVWTLEEAAIIAEMSGAENVSLVADVYNLARGESTLDSIRDFGGEISMLHLNDSPHERYDELDLVSARTFPGDGVLSPADWAKAAIEGGFEGALSIEIFPEDVWAMESSEAAQLCARKIEYTVATIGQAGSGLSPNQ